MTYFLSALYEINRLFASIPLGRLVLTINWMHPQWSNLFVYDRLWLILDPIKLHSCALACAYVWISIFFIRNDFFSSVILINNIELFCCWADLEKSHHQRVSELQRLRSMYILLSYKCFYSSCFCNEVFSLVYWLGVGDESEACCVWPYYTHLPTFINKFG